MSDRVESSGLSVDSGLYQLVEEIAAGSGVGVDDFWQSLAAILDELGAQNRELLDQRDRLQDEIDSWHKANPGAVDRDRYKAFLQDIGYLEPEPEAFQVSTQNVDDEVALIAGPQLVVPVDNARYALNAANARWYSLYDALYGTDIDRSKRDGAARGDALNTTRCGAQKVIALCARIPRSGGATGRRLAMRTRCRICK